MISFARSRLTRPSGRLAFAAAPAGTSAWVSALLEPLAAVAVFALLTELPPRRPWFPVGAADKALLLLVLALTFPAPDRLFAPRVARWSEALVNAGTLAVILLLCTWAVQALAHVTLPLWLAWLVLVPVVHQGLIEAVAWGWQQRMARRPKPRAVVVGCDPMGVRTARALRRLRGPDAREFLGWVEARGDSTVAEGSAVTPPGRRRLGDLRALRALLTRQAVDEVYVTLGPTAPQWPAELLQALHDSTASVLLVPDVLQTVVLHGQVRTLDGLPVIGVMQSPFAGPQGWIKRFSDVVLAVLALLLLWPVMLAVALWVRLDSPGPVLFRQRRTGLNGRCIEVWKFRTMTVMEDGARVEQARPDDARLTRAGRWLRRTSLDELPQFINVLQGRMSVVGPRPHALAHNDHYRSLVQAYMVRHKVRPGITGWAQVNGLRGETDTVDKMRRRVEHDLAYLQNWSLALDLQIILRTVALVFKDVHAH